MIIVISFSLFIVCEILCQSLCPYLLLYRLSLYLSIYVYLGVSDSIYLHFCLSSCLLSLPSCLILSVRVFCSIVPLCTFLFMNIWVFLTLSIYTSLYLPVYCLSLAASFSMGNRVNFFIHIMYVIALPSSFFICFSLLLRHLFIFFFFSFFSVFN